jgi:hypothetical protein
MSVAAERPAGVGAVCVELLDEAADGGTFNGNETG